MQVAYVFAQFSGEYFAGGEQFRDGFGLEFRSQGRFEMLLGSHVK